MAEFGPDGQVAETERLQREVARLNKVVQALMNRVERSSSPQASDFSLFQTAAMLEEQVRARTRELEAALREKDEVARALQAATTRLEREKEEQRALIHKLEEAQNQLLQSEKLASIGQLAAGVAHEINNPIGFVNSNLLTLAGYLESLLGVIDVYEEAAEPALEGASPARQRIAEAKQAADLDYLREDVRALVSESVEGTARVRRIVQDLRDFSRTGSTEWQMADLHQGIESTLNVAANEIKYKAEVKREFGELPMVECVAAQLNQVFLNLLVNAAHAIPERGTITIRSGCDADQVWIAFSDDGSGIAPEVLPRIFEPFFTTKPVGSGTGLGLSVSYGIVQRHGGHLEVESRVGEGTTFTIRLPVRRPQAA